jgi:hypothetical protein
MLDLKVLLNHVFEVDKLGDEHVAGVLKIVGE